MKTYILTFKHKFTAKNDDETHDRMNSFLEDNQLFGKDGNFKLADNQSIILEEILDKPHFK